MSTSSHLITYEEALTMPESNLEEVWKSDLRTTSDPYSHIVPELVIEMVSPANRKGAVQRLLQNYADFGIPEVLPFHSGTRTYESYSGINLVHTAQAGSVSPQTMPEVTIDLDQLWTEF
jgi:Uma2 family endonuclease